MHYFLFILAVVMITVSILMISRRFKVLLSGGSAIGHIIGHQKRNGDDSVSYHPIFAFSDHKGIQHEITANSGWSSISQPVGTKVKIIYLRNNPEFAFIDSFYHLWFWPFLLFVFALILLLTVWLPNSCLNAYDKKDCSVPVSQL